MSNDQNTTTTPKSENLNMGQDIMQSIAKEDFYTAKTSIEQLFALSNSTGQRQAFTTMRQHIVVAMDSVYDVLCDAFDHMSEEEQQKYPVTLLNNTQIDVGYFRVIPITAPDNIINDHISGLGIVIPVSQRIALTRANYIIPCWDTQYRFF